MCIWACWTTSWFPELMQHSEKVELCTSRIEPRPTQLIASRSGVRGTWVGSGRGNYGLPYLQIWTPWILRSGVFWRVKPALQNTKILEAPKNRLMAFWNEISEETVRASCSQIPDRLRGVVKAKREYIEN